MHINRKILDKINHLGDLYRKEYFKKYIPQLLERNWWSGLSLFLNHSFYQGRKDEVSKLVEDVAKSVLVRYFSGKNISELKVDLRKVEKELN
jgi:hypothetical protein